MTIRDAQPSDVAEVVPLIHSTAPGFLDTLFGMGDQSRTLQVLSNFYLHADSRFGYRHGRIMEIDHHPAGILIGLPGEALLWLNLSLARLIVKELGMRSSLRLLGILLHIPDMKEAEAGEWYIAHLATSPAFRRRGVGKALLEDAAEHAAAQRRKRCSLLVDVDNLGAISLYQQMGFKVVETFDTLPQQKFMHSRGHYRMIREMS